MSEAGGRFTDLAWLTGIELRNRTVAMAARLRDPKYLIGFLVGIGYFVILFLPATFSGSGEPTTTPPWVVHAAPFALAGLVLFWWLRGGYEQALAFRPAEVQFLFTAPLKRSALIRYKLLRAQAGVVFSAALVTLFGRGAELPWTLTFLGAWVLVATLHLHQLGASLVRVTAAGSGRAGLRRAAVPLTVATLLGAALLWMGGRAIAGARSAGTMEGAMEAALAAVTEPFAVATTLPFRLLLDATLAETAGAWAIGMMAGLGLLALHVMWVVRSDAAFEEAGAEAGRRRAEMVAAARAGKAWWRLGQPEEKDVRRWLRLPLRPTGEPALALTWQQVLAFAGDIRPRTLLFVLFGGVAIFLAMLWGSGSVAGAASGVAGISAVFAGFLVFFGPLVFRYDFRRDLSRLELLRSYPIDPRWLVMAELAGPVILLTVIELVLISIALVLLPLTGVPGDRAPMILVGALFAAVNVPGLLALQVAVQNGLALLFPGWTRLGPTRGSGIDAVGQNILSFLGAALAFAALLVLPVLAALLVGGSYGSALGRWALVPGGMAFTGAVWAQVVWLAGRLARAYTRLDPVEAGLLR